MYSELIFSGVMAVFVLLVWYIFIVHKNAIEALAEISKGQDKKIKELEKWRNKLLKRATHHKRANATRNNGRDPIIKGAVE